MPIYSERNSLTLLSNASDPDGDPVTVARVNGSAANIGQPVVLTGGVGGAVTVTVQGVVTLDDSGVTPPPIGQSALAGTFTYSLTDGVLESAVYTAAVELHGTVASGFRFGALTSAGAGGLPASNFTPDTHNHFELSGGYIVPTPIGATAGLDQGSYAVTINGNPETIVIEPDTYTVRTDAELAAIIALGSLARSGKTIWLRAGTYSAYDFSNLINTLPCTITSDSRDVVFTAGYRSTPETFPDRSGEAEFLGTTNLTNALNWRFRNVRFYKAIGGGSGDKIVWVNSATDLEFSRCEIYSDVTAKDAAGQGLPVGVKSDGGNIDPTDNIKILDCFFHDLYENWHIAIGRGVNHFKRNTMRDTYLNIMKFKRSLLAGKNTSSYELESNVSIGNFHDTNDPGGPHSAQVSHESIFFDSKLNANIFLPVYDRCKPGAPDMDKETMGTNNEIKGNISVSHQSLGFGIQGMYGSRIIGNTNYVRNNLNGPPNDDNGTGPVIRLINQGGEYGSIVAHNICMGDASGPRWGILGGCFWSGGTPPQSAVKTENNLGIGHAGTSSTTAGVITDEPNGATPGPVINGQPRDVRADLIFQGVNANAGFYRIQDPINLHVNASLQGAFGTWVGAVGHGYVTLSAGHTWSDHLTDPQDLVINTAMEPTAP